MQKQTVNHHSLFRLIAFSLAVVALTSFAAAQATQWLARPGVGGAVARLTRLLGLERTAPVNAVTDLDGDGYGSLSSGGNDCTDTLSSVYSDGTAGCSTSATATFLASKSDPDSDDDIADHAWVKDANGLYHLYYQNEDQGSGDDIEHYTSTDLQSLSYVGLALQKNASGWDSYGLWAPHVVKNGNTYFMFYTGTTGAGANPNAKQRIGLATSSDLTTWTKYPINNCSGTSGNGCLYECNESWTTWGGTPGSYNQQCRDPFVIWDAANSRWLMFTTVRLSTGGSALSGGVSVASSTNLTSWTGLGYIKATRRLLSGEGGTLGQLNGTQAENPYVTKYNNTYYLFFTDWEDVEDSSTTQNPRTQIQYATSATLGVDSSGSTNWTYRGYTPDPGVNAMEAENWFGDTWIMSQSVANNNSGDYGSHPRELRLKRVLWGDNFSFTTSTLSKLSCRVSSASIHPGAAEICSDNVDNNCSGSSDEALYCGACTDADGDSYGSSGLYQCSKSQLDCNDSTVSAYPGATETCDSVDNNCDGSTDEGGVCTASCTESWGCGAWSACEDKKQTRACTDVNRCGTTLTKPAVEQSCTATSTPAPTACTERWVCDEWSGCRQGVQTRSCLDTNACGTTATQPATLKTCIVPAEIVIVALPVSSRANIEVATPDGKSISRFQPFSPKIGTMSVAAGDINGDDQTDIVAGSGPKSRPVVRIFSASGKKWGAFEPFSRFIQTGVLTAVGDIDGDNFRDIVTLPGPGSRSRFETFRYDGTTKRFSRQRALLPNANWQNAFDFTLDDLNGDTRAELIIVPRGHAEPVVSTFTFDSVKHAWVFDARFSASAWKGRRVGSDGQRLVSLTTGDVDGDGQREIITGQGKGFSPFIRVFSASGKPLTQFYAGAQSSRRGLIVSALDQDGDGSDEIIAIDASGSDRRLRYYKLASDTFVFRLQHQVTLLPNRETALDLRSAR